MTKEQFLVGWNLLAAQPWGRRYDTVNDRASAITAATQLQFYFKKLSVVPHDLWMAECELYAAGDHWPSVDELKQSCNNALPKVKRIEYRSENSECPEPIALSLAHAEAHNTTFLEGMQAVLPAWCRENPTHADHDRAMVLFRKFEHAKPSGLFNAAKAMKS